MRKLVQGVIDFHQNILPKLRQQFSKLAQGQSPDSLMIACSDSRVVPNLFASTDPGDLFVVRNPGNLIPPANQDKSMLGGQSEAAAIEIAIESLTVTDIVVCGHSSCAGMAALLNEAKTKPHLKQWNHYAQEAKRQLEQGKAFDSSLSLQDQLSQLNVIVQLDHLNTYPEVKKRHSAGQLRLHGWWFDISTGNVYAFEPDEKKFLIIDEQEGARILQRLGV
jgi:carbonic anhydrase